MITQPSVAYGLNVSISLQMSLHLSGHGASAIGLTSSPAYLPNSDWFLGQNNSQTFKPPQMCD